MDVAHLPNPVLITRLPELSLLVDQLCGQNIIAVDTESNSLHAYREQVCLVQFSTSETDYLVDPLALDDLSQLAPLFANPGIEKIFHAAEYDVLCLKRDFDFEFANLFDTMVAARILGREAVGLGAMLEGAFGVQLDKRFQRANWGQRPLPPHLLDYARLDTHYLIDLRNRLYTELEQRDLLPLAQEDFSRLAAFEPSDGDSSGCEKPLNCWRVKGSYDLEPQQAAVLLELCCYRERAAQANNRPLFKVIGDRTLYEIAASLPRSAAALSQLPGMSRGQMQRHGKHLLRAVERGLKAEPLYPPRPPRPSEAFLDRLEQLRQWRKQAAQKMGVKSDVVLPRDLLYSLAEQNPRSPSALAGVMDEVPWRLSQFGEQILNVLNGRSPV